MLVADRPVWHVLRTVIAVTAGIVLAPTAAHAQVFGAWAPAVPYPTDSYHAGAFVLIGEPFGLVGQLRTGIDQNWDVGVQLGFPDFDRGNSTVFGVAGDVKYLILPEKSGEFPLDMALDVAFGLQHVEDFNLVDFDFGAVASKTTTTSGGTTLIPYGSLMMAIGHASIDLPPGVQGDASDTDLDVNVRFGLDYPMTSDLEFLSELNVSSRDETIALALGLMCKL